MPESTIIDFFTSIIGDIPNWLYGPVYVISILVFCFGLYLIFNIFKILFSPFFRG